MNIYILIPLIAYLLLIAVIGVWAGVKQKRSVSGQKSESYFVGSRQLGFVVLVFSLLASAASAGTFVGVPGLAYRGGYAWLVLFLFQMPTAFIGLSLLGKKYAILARKLNFITYTDILKHRYENKFVVILTTIAIVVFLIAYMTAQYAGGAHILHSVTGVPYSTLVVVFAGIVAIYTTFGGFIAASVNDTAQGLIMLIGGIVLWFTVFITLGGTTPLEGNLADKFPDLVVMPGDTDATIAGLIAYSLEFGFLLIVLPHVAVRAMSYRNSKSAHRAMIAGPIIMALFTVGFGAMGVAARLFSPHLDNVDLALPLLIVDHVPKFLAGALLAAPLAAVMSTVSSMLLVVSGSIVRDTYVNFVKPDLSDRTSEKLSMAVTFGIGVLVLALSLKPPEALELIVVFSIAGIEASLAAPLIGGLYWKRGNATGTILAMIGGFSWFMLSSQFFPVMAFGFPPIFFSVVASTILYIVGSCFSAPPSREVLVKFWGTQEEIDRLGQL